MSNDRELLELATIEAVGAVDLEVLVGFAVDVTDLRVLLRHRGFPTAGESTNQLH